MLTRFGGQCGVAMQDATPGTELLPDTRNKIRWTTMKRPCLHNVGPGRCLVPAILKEVMLSAAAQRSQTRVHVCSRAFIRHLCDDENLPVPSPTFLLLNSYPCKLPRPAAAEALVHHIDMYRLADGPGGVDRINIGELRGEGVCLVEWASRMGAPPKPSISVDISVLSEVRGHRSALSSNLFFKSQTECAVLIVVCHTYNRAAKAKPAERSELMVACGTGPQQCCSTT
jgi:tRNA A37 threonylcarbamoyladenosine biosynthesis protein TsaE